MTFFYRRSITDRGGNVVYVVYAVIPIPGEKPDPVPVIAGFPAGWVPTENPGQCLAKLGSEAAIFETFVPRSQFRHHERTVRFFTTPGPTRTSAEQ
ncbi:MAG TPA: hypothetical protein VKA54_16720 [Gemmatimonadaceae bacterium]|nr:hypothetical protein [Gemmatimonadaceae bacterium]